MFIQLSILTGALPNRWSCLSDGRSGSVKDLNAQTRVFRDRADFFKEGDMALESFSSPKASPDGAMQCFGATVKARN